MKKSKLFLTCLAAMLGLTTLLFAGCSGKTDGGGTGGGTEGGGGGTVTPPELEVPTAPVLNNMSQYFKGARVVYGKESLKDENNAERPFSELLNRQFDVLAEDILYRLQVVYGTINNGVLSDYNLNYSYNGNTAKVIISNLLLDTGTHDSMYHKVGIDSGNTLSNIECRYCFQQVINRPANTSLNLNDVSRIKLNDAINGGNMNWSVSGQMLYKNEDKKWAVTDLNSTNAKDIIKLEIAKIVADNTSSNYDTLLTKINKLGFDKKEISKKLVDAINNNIIGNNLVSENLSIYNSFTEEEKSNILPTLSAEKHLYKGYNIVVPAIVDMALSNTFENTSTSLYPVVGKESTEIVNFGQTVTTKNYKSMYLMPDGTNVKPTKINIKVMSDSASVGKTIKIFATVKNAGGVIKNKFAVATVNLTNSGQDISVLLDTATIGMYNGSQKSFLSTSLFGNAAAMPDELALCGTNYIKFEFENASNANFGINFLGMYNKI